MIMLIKKLEVFEEAIHQPGDNHTLFLDKNGYIGDGVVLRLLVKQVGEIIDFLNMEARVGRQALEIKPPEDSTWRGNDY